MRTGEEVSGLRESAARDEGVMRKAFVYISGPITPSNGRTIEDNVALAVKTFCELTRQGIPSFAPHLGAAFPSCHEIDYHIWMAYDLAVLARCTHILMLPGWEKSKGAVLERTYAVGAHIPILYSIEELVEMIWRKENV